jgi:hypothetical protein
MAMLRMTALLGLVALVLLPYVVTSCDTLNVGLPPQMRGRGPIPTVTVPAGMNGTEAADWTVAWIGGEAPYTIAMAMGGGAADVPAGTPAVSPFAQTFTMVNPSKRNSATYTYAVTVTEADGMFDVATATYTVGPTLNIAPTIDDLDFTACVLTVTVSDDDETGALSVGVAVPAGMAVDASPKDAAQVSSATATFTLSATNLIAGASGDVSVTVTDSLGATDTDTIEVTIDPLVLAMPAGALGAFALSSSGTVGGGPVTIVIVTGDLDAAEPFNFCDGVGFTINAGADYAAGTFNIGAVGGDADASDGIWGDMSPLPIGYIMPQDWMMAFTALAGDPTMGRIDFNATAIGGSGVTAGGAILNFGLEFSAAGTYDLGFQYFEDVRRTFYSGPDSTTYEWDNLDNDNDYNTITVT